MNALLDPFVFMLTYYVDLVNSHAMIDAFHQKMNTQLKKSIVDLFLSSSKLGCMHPSLVLYSLLPLFVRSHSSFFLFLFCIFETNKNLVEKLSHEVRTRVAADEFYRCYSRKIYACNKKVLLLN